MNVTWSTRRKATATAMAIGASLVAALVVGCRATSATKAGKTTGPVVLRMANGSSDLSYEPAVAYFVERVGEVSHGGLRVDAVSGWGKYQPNLEQQIVRDVASGKADLAWVGTRIFDTLGVRSFQALTAPMLIDSYPLERAVIASEIPGRMLKGLDKLEVSGLAVLADGLRKPIAVKRPLLGPADWRDLTFEAFRSRGQAEAIRALGARPNDDNLALERGLDEGRVQGFEKGLRIYQINELQVSAPYVTANVNLWPQTVALLANPSRLSRLTRDQQRWLLQAAVDATARSTSLFDRDAQILAAVCKSGARFANASESELRALKRAFAPVYTNLEQDRQTKAFIARIEQLKHLTPAGPALAIPAGCAVHAKADSSSP